MCHHHQQALKWEFTCQALTTCLIYSEEWRPSLRWRATLLDHSGASFKHEHCGTCLFVILSTVTCPAPLQPCGLTDTHCSWCQSWQCGVVFGMAVPGKQWQRLERKACTKGNQCCWCRQLGKFLPDCPRQCPGCQPAALPGHCLDPSASEG